MARRSRHFSVVGQLLPVVLLSIGWASLHEPLPAFACGRIYSTRLQSKQSIEPRFRLKNGLQLGADEADVIKILGEPDTREAGGLRCPSKRVRLSYGNQTTITLDSPQPRRQAGALFVSQRPSQLPSFIQASLTPSSRLRNRRPHNSKKPLKPVAIMVSLSTRDAQFELHRGIRIGDSLQKVVRTYGKPQFQIKRDNKVFIGYRQGHERLRLQFINDRLHTIQLNLR